MICFVLGLPGSGKSTVGTKLAATLKWDFFEIDTALTDEMKANISAGKLLSDAELYEWLIERAIPEIEFRHTHDNLVVSGMLGDQNTIKLYGEKFPGAVFINLELTYTQLLQRVEGRADHFAKKEILDLCWNNREALIAPGVRIDASGSVAEVVERCLKILQDN